jgi:hydrogenase maturation protease
VEGGPVLIVGYGSTLRSDDGLGPRVAEAIGARELPNVEALACPQLTPELAEPISQASVVVFVDAAVDEPRQVRFQELDPKRGSQFAGHTSDPGSVLALAQDVFGRIPQAWLLRIPAENLELGEEFSALGQRGFRTAVARIQRFLATRELA